MVDARQELAGGRAVVDRQRDPRLDHQPPGLADRQAADRRRQGRSTPPGRSSSARTSTAACPTPGSAAGPDPRACSTASASTTTPPRRSTRCTRSYPNTFLFESESSSETSTRGVYQDPDQLNTGENYTPGKRATSSYDNNLASWTMSGEYGLKKDRDRKYFPGQFLWSGIDYIGEPTPYNVFPVKSSFFGAVDTAGFPKDIYYLFQSQWTSDADGPPGADELDATTSPARRRRCGPTPTSTPSSCSSTATRSACGASTTRRPPTARVPGDHRGHRRRQDRHLRPYPGSYTSPNGSAGKLHLTWNVPFAPGQLIAVARPRRPGGGARRGRHRRAGRTR